MLTITKLYILIAFLLLFSLFIYFQKEINKEINKEKEPFIDHLVLPPVLAGRIRPFYRNHRKYYREIYEKYSNMINRHMKQHKLL